MFKVTNQKGEIINPPFPPLLKGGNFFSSLFEREAGRDFREGFYIWEKV
jgi:hypothetical protein